MLVTKHCKAEHRRAMLEGSFFIGSHRLYSGGEKAGLMSDDAEGLGTTLVKGMPDSFTGTVGGAHFSGLRVGGAATNLFKINHGLNCHLFCASEGDYSRKRHKLMVKGSKDYPPNTNTVAYIVLDKERLAAALKASSDELFARVTTWIAAPVKYGRREETIPVENFYGLSNVALSIKSVKSAFQKPTKFKLEEEFRFALLPGGSEIGLSYSTETMSKATRQAFINAIVSEGEECKF